jgi:endonuclease/exonuclease/phosphatase (EEP) superfamily protein YafD
MFVFVGGLGGAIFTLLAFMGKFSWQLDLLSHFRVQYFWGLVIIALILLAGNRYLTATVCAVFAVINMAILLPFYFGGSDSDNASAIRLLLSNVNTQTGSPTKVAELIEREKPDIIVLEEIGFRWMELVADLKQVYPYSCIKIRNDNFGIGLFSRYPLKNHEMKYFGGSGVPTIVAAVKTPSGLLNIIATHPLPPGGKEYSEFRNNQMSEIADYIAASKQSPLVLLGDLNMTPWNGYFKDFVKQSGLCDSSKGWGIQPTWPTFNQLLKIPLDHCLYSSDIVIVNRVVGTDVGSDHYPLIVDIAIK